ncbi:MAG: cation:proton antiporter [Bryobacterales bacterium]|nr:cation:proton antiporter [Bryobacterales bacterium]
MVSALLSGLVERTGFPQVAIFLALGACIGPIGLGLLDAGLQSPILRVVATLSLVLVLFTDAVSLNLTEVRTHKLLAVLVLGPGTLLSAALTSAAAHWILGLTVPMALILAASLASSDPVLLRGVLKRPELSARVKQALRLESGMNDAVLLPVVLVTMTFLSQGGFSGGDWAKLLLNILLLSPAAGVVVALASIGLLEFVRRRMGVRRDYESIYSLGVAFAAFAAAESIHGSGFLAAFAAGIAISALDVELCDCFLEYGETTAEMALMFTFVLFGTSLIWTGFSAATPAALVFTALVFLLRPAAFQPALWPARLDWRERMQIGWFGPKGLSSLLLILLPVFASIRGSEPLLTLCCFIVLCSVALHGLSPLLLGKGAVTGEPETKAAHTITIDELRALFASGARHYIVDSRSERTHDEGLTIPGSIRLHPDSPVVAATQAQLARDAVLAVFCA